MGLFDAFRNVFKRKPALPPKPARPHQYVTLDLLRAVAPGSPDALLVTCVDPLNRACEQFGIRSNLDVAAFVAQVAHESDGFRAVEEYASGKAYEGRADLGNTVAGDGVKYKGAGYMMTTGRANQRRVAQYFGVPFDKIGLWLRTPDGAALSAALYWDDHNLSALANAKRFDEVSRVINGGDNGRDDRRARYAAALAVFDSYA